MGTQNVELNDGRQRFFPVFFTSKPHTNTDRQTQKRTQLHLLWQRQQPISRFGLAFFTILLLCWCMYIVSNQSFAMKNMQLSKKKKEKKITNRFHIFIKIGFQLC
jgi:hypothetical protein